MSKLDFAKIKERLAKIPDELKGKETQVGWFESAQYDDGTSVAYVATIHEFGAPAQGIPARPMIAPTVSERKTEWAEILRDGVKAVGEGRVTGRDVLDGVGQQAAGDIKQTISKINSPALKPETVKRKGFAKPLVDTALMLNSVSNKVNES